MLISDLHNRCQTAYIRAQTECSFHELTHQCHKAHASADIPHFDSFVSGARQKERSRFPTLLTLESKQKIEPTLCICAFVELLIITVPIRKVGFCLHSSTQLDRLH